MAKFCTHCGSPLQGNEKFCTKCGKSLNATSQSNVVDESLRIKNHDTDVQVHNKIENNPIEPSISTNDSSKPLKRESWKKSLLITIITCISVVVGTPIIIGLIYNVFSSNKKEKLEPDYELNPEPVEEVAEATVTIIEDFPDDINSYVNPEIYNNNLNLTRFINNYPSGFSIKELGKNWNWKENYYKGNVILFSEGMLDKSFFRMVTYLTPDGLIFGRYYNENGTHLDVNGYIKNNADIEIQLGHKNETSYMTLIPDEVLSTENSFVYTGEWGKKKKPVEIVFYPNNSYFSNNIPDFKDNHYNPIPKLEEETFDEPITVPAVEVVDTINIQ